MPIKVQKKNQDKINVEEVLVILATMDTYYEGGNEVVVDGLKYLHDLVSIKEQQSFGCDKLCIEEPVCPRA